MSFSFSKLKAWEGNNTYWVTAKIRPRELIKFLYPRKYIHAKYGKVYFHKDKFTQKSISRILISAKINFLKVEHLRTAASEMQVLSQWLQRHINLLKFKMKISAHEVVLVVLLNFELFINVFVYFELKKTWTRKICRPNSHWRSYALNAPSKQPIFLLMMCEILWALCDFEHFVLFINCWCHYCEHQINTEANQIQGKDQLSTNSQWKKYTWRYYNLATKRNSDKEFRIY